MPAPDPFVIGKRSTPPAAPARYVLAVGSGKGGVGKSTVSLNLALALAEAGASVGLLDADLYGPNIPLMVGLARQQWSGDWTLARAGGAGAQRRFEPIDRYGLKIVSAGFIIAEDQPMGIAGSTIRLLLDQLVYQVDWGALDYLVMDLPPGTSDVQQALLQSVAVSGAILVVTPQDVAHLDGKKALRQYHTAGVPVLGAVENMSGLLCPHCGEMVDVFARVPDNRSLWAMGVERLGSIPLDPALSRAGDQGRPLLAAQPASLQAAAFRRMASTVRERLGDHS